MEENRLVVNDNFYEMIIYAPMRTKTTILYLELFAMHQENMVKILFQKGHINIGEF